MNDRHVQRPNWQQRQGPRGGNEYWRPGPASQFSRYRSLMVIVGACTSTGALSYAATQIGGSFPPPSAPWTRSTLSLQTTCVLRFLTESRGVNSLVVRARPPTGKVQWA